MRSAVRFILGTQAVEVGGFDPHLTVLEWLRTERFRTGTKEGCAEGDCGACTVVVGECSDGKMSYKAVNSCIQLLGTLDGKQLITVEDLQSDGPGQALHPVQQAMVDCDGSQCGFCTPGFVMALFALYHAERSDPRGELSRQEIDAALAGNLCRCTGYAPIVRAARAAIPGPGEVADPFSAQQESLTKQLGEFVVKHSLAIEHAGRRFCAPQDARTLIRLLDKYPEAVMFAGATDVGLWITKQLRRFETLIYLGQVDELRHWRVDDEAQMLEIGAAVTYSEVYDELVRIWPDFEPMLSRLGAHQVRNVGTIGGNIANGSPIGDMPPALMVLCARLELSSSVTQRVMNLDNFFIEYGRQDLEPGEFVAQILIPLPPPEQSFRCYKLSRRFDQDISSVCGAFAVNWTGGRMESVRVAFGGMAGVPARASGCERVLEGQRPDPELLEQACEALTQDFAPMTDWRGSDHYRNLGAQQLLRRFFTELSNTDKNSGAGHAPAVRAEIAGRARYAGGGAGG